ncbi:transcription factor bHLH153-like isoform X2 [Rhododendron vialii]|uniref:transcription factor bHLH153-like isoform X2 n=1 Tax=Rhododendron vialii TaxID=182163 RepID=UPI00265D6B04|nr:transcription factor bHLH153-like isoform X2 [Rhododendron vialii]
MIEQKRSPISIDQSSHTAFAPKRHKADLSISSKETKEKLGEKIAALQQLVSPYGKTDTASVLLEAMEYITFLHEQVTVLSAPYLQSIPTANMQVRISWCNSLQFNLQGNRTIQSAEQRLMSGANFMDQRR